jgi:transposase
MTDTLEKVEVITSRQRRRRWSAAEKMRMVEESLEPGASVSLVARRHGVNPNQLFTWRRLAAHGAFTAAAAGEEVVPASDYRALQEQIRDLHRLLGKKTLEAVSWPSFPWTSICRRTPEDGCFRDAETRDPGAG